MLRYAAERLILMAFALFIIAALIFLVIQLPPGDYLSNEIVQLPDDTAMTPLRIASDAESAVVVDRAFLIYLNLYLIHFGKLSAKEQRALTMVEVLGVSYRDAAAELGIRLENLKMVIFRARRKILRGMTRTLSEVASRNERRFAFRQQPTARGRRAGSTTPSSPLTTSA